MAALSGVRVLELTHFLAGPYAGLILADMGADVVKVEDPRHADEARTMSPRDARDESLYFMALNWGKRSVGVDLSSEQGRDVVLDLVREADVVLDNYRPGVLRKLGLDHDSLVEVNPSLITCSLTGYGETGPYSRHAGYDYTIQAVAGVMDLAGEPDGPPTKAGISYVDHSGGLAAALAVCAALLERARTGTGKHFDLALLDVQYSMLTYLAAWNLNAGTVPTRQPASAHPSLVPAQNFRTSDGYVALFVGNDPMWARLVDVLDDDLLADERFRTREGRRRHADVLLTVLQDLLLKGTAAEWSERLTAAGVACAPVNDLTSALHDVQARARGLVAVDDVDGRPFQHVRGPVLDHATGSTTPPPRLGEDSCDVLVELGYDERRVAALVDAGVVVTGPG
jgi:crotonobetainyl-CoA:carnitine CoA-transferase CaiB-like acyl-CoA transferase